MKKVVSIKELIENKTKLEERHAQSFALEVEGVGVFEFLTPGKSLVDDAREFNEGKSFDEFIVAESMMEPNLASKELLDAYGAITKMDLVKEIFLPGELSRIAGKIVEKAGYNEKVLKEIDILKN